MRAWRTVGGRSASVSLSVSPLKVAPLRTGRDPSCERRAPPPRGSAQEEEPLRQPRQQARLGVISGRFGGANQSVLSSFALAYGVLEKVTREAEKRSAHRYHDLVIGHKHHRAQDP